MSLLGFDPNQYRTTTAAQTKPQEQGRFGDVVDSFQAGAASGLGGIFDFIGADGIAKSLYGIANDQYSQMSSRGQDAMGKQMFQTNAKGETELGDGMTDLDTWLLQMANVAGQFVPTAVPGAGAAGLATKALSLGSKGAKVAQAVGMGATGGSAATGQAMDQARQEVLKMPDQVLADSDLFKQTFLNIDAQSPELDDVSKWNQAKSQLAEQVASEVRSDPKALLANFAASAIGDPVIGRALTGVRLAKSGALRSALAGGITEGATEATQAGVSQYAVDNVLSQIDQRDPMAGVKLAALNEGIIGAGFGAGAGGIGGIANRNVVDREPANSQPAKNPAADPIRESNPTVAGAMDADAQQAADRKADIESMAQAQPSQQPNYDQPTAARRAGMGDTMQAGRFGDEAIARDNAMKGRSFPTVPEQFNKSPLTQAMDSVQGLTDQRREGEWLPPEGEGRSPVTGLLAAPFIDGENLNRQRTRDTMAAQPTNLIGQSDTIFANDGRARQAAQEFADTAARQTAAQPKQITDKGIIFAPDNFSPRSQGINVKSNNTPFASAKEALISKGARAAKREGAEVEAVKLNKGFGWRVVPKVEPDNIESTENGLSDNKSNINQLKKQRDRRYAENEVKQAENLVFETQKKIEQQVSAGGRIDILSKNLQRQISGANKIRAKYGLGPMDLDQDLADNKSNRATGKTSKVFTPSNKEIETEYQLIEADELIASNDFTGKVDPRYPASRQPRDRSRASSQLQIAAIANDPNPARLADSAESDRGAPIVSGNIVESGNGRSIGLKEAYARGSAEKYRKYLVDNAEQFGLTPEQISAMKSPVLVRQRITDLTEDEIRAFTVDSNKSASLELSPMESAKADSETITDDMLDILSVPDNGNVLSSDNRQFIQAFTKAMNQQELARYLAADGSFNKDFANRVERAIFAKGYNNDKLLELVAESATTEQKNVLNSLANVAGKMARLRSVNQDVWSEVSNILSDATALVMQAKRDGKALSELTSQGDMMTGYVPSEVDTMATAIDANIRSGKKITSMLDGVITSLINANINQGSMFDTEQLTPQQAIAYVKQQQQSQQTPRASADLFGANPPKLPRSGEGQTDSVQTTGRAEPEVTSNTVSKNTVFTEEAAEEARKKLRAMLGTFNSGFNPDVMQAGITLAGYHIEKGARTFAAYAKAMIADMGDAVKPYLKSWYMGVKYDPRAAAFDGMDNAATVDSFDLAELENDNDQYSAINQESDSQGGADTGSTANESNANDRRKQVGRATAVNGGRGGSQEQLTNAMDDGVPTADSASSIQPIRDEKSRLANDVPRDSDSIGRLPDSTAGIQPEPVGAKATANIVKQAPEVSVKAKPLASVGEYRSADKEQIRASMPFLTPGQVEDVAFTENRFSQPDGTGVLFTNGTGTGKTFLGLGVVRRFIEQGKENVLVLVPKQPIVDAWVGAGRKFFDLNINAIKDTSDSGQGVSVTTYANLIANPGLIGKRDFDLIIADESHYLSSDKDGSITKALKAVRAIAKMPGTSLTRVNAKNPELAEKIAEGVSAIEQLRAGNAFAGKAHDDIHEWLDPLVRKRSELEAEERKYLASIPVSERPKTMLLSATPLAYEKNVVIGQGLLYDWNEGMEDNSGAGYNSGGNFERFMMQHFGYRMRYNKLTEPEAEVDRGLMQRQFNAWLKQRGVLSGRTLDSDFDYDRRFVMTESAIGKRVDDALSWLRENDGEDITALREKIVGENFNYHSRMYFLEAIKAREALPIIRDHLALGRRVVVMHDFKQGGVVNPFWLSNPEPEIVGAYERFRREFSDLIRSFQSLPSPIQTITKAFPDALVYNGDVSGKNRVAMQEVFNSDEPGTPNLIIAQGDAMREGVSIHDTSGKAQRVLIHLGMPGKPTAAIQQEGRIYRTGQASDAIFRYLTIGTSWERTAFASTIATRAATAENLAMGEQARGLKQSFINAYEEADDYPAGMEGEGKGGKAADAAMAKLLTPWDLAKSLYFGTKKYGKGRSADREGVDYFATPEPVGMKMVQLADIRPGEKVLEPSAGHGAIARWFPENTESRAIEPSEGLSSRMALHFVGDIVSSRFEDHNTINKYDAIVMNPPYGVGGKTAAEHVEKAIKHLRPWGRVVALIPTGPAADKRFDALLYGDDNKDIHLAANIKMPSVTFERAGTSVSTRIIVLEKVPPKYEGQLKTATRDYSNIEDIKSLFERMESLEIHPRGKPVEEVSEVTATIDSAEPLTTDDINSTNFEYTGETYTTKSSGKVQQVITLRERVDYDKYKALQNIAKKHGGWNRGQKFMFNTGAKLKAFAEEADTELNGNSAPEMLYSKTAKGVNRGARQFTQAEAQRAVDDVMKRLSGAAGIRVNLFTSQDEFLSRFNVPAMAMEGQTIYGAYDDRRNSAYLILDNFKSIDELRSTLVHEVLAHGGLHTVIGEQKYQQFINKLNSSRSRKEFKALWDRIDKDYAGASDAVKAEEVFANFVQNQPERGTAKAWWFELKQWLRRQFEGLGILRKNHARNEMEDMIKAIVRGFDKRKQRMDRASAVLDRSGKSPVDISYSKAVSITDTPEFKRWFGDSKVVDENGEPLVMYHGTSSIHINEFEGWRGVAGHFAFDPDLANFYANDSYSDAVVEGVSENAAPVIYPVYLKASNIFDIRNESHRSKVGIKERYGNYETLEQYANDIYTAEFDAYYDFEDDSNRSYPIGIAVFRKEQIKSATGNNGQFDPNNPDIRFSMAFEDDTRTAKQKLGLEEEAEQTLKEKITENYRNTADTLKQSSFWSRLNEGIFDGLHGIKKAEEAAGITDPNKMGYVSARLASGLSDVLHGVFHYGAPMWKDGIIQRKADTKGLLEVFGMLPDGELNNWLAWMGANRAKQLKAEGRENNLSQSDIDELLALANGKEKLFEEVRAEYNKINSAVLDVAQEAGLISEAQRAGFDEEYYVPFFREQDVDPEMQDIASMVTAPFTKKGIAGQSAKIKALKGGKQSTKDLLENIILRQSTMLDAALKNKAMLEVADNLDGTQFMTQVDSPEFAKLSQRELNSIQRVKVMRDGQAVAYAVTDPALLRGLIAVNDVGSQALFNRMGRSAKRFLTAGVTLSPDFIFKNFIRDAAHAWMINKDDFKFGTDSIKGLKKAFKEDEAYRDLIFSGAAFQGGYIHGADPEAAAQQIRRALAQKGLAKGQIDSYMDSLVTSGSKLFEKYRNLSDKVENANRLSTYEAGLAAGKSRRQAAFEAKDLMDYSLKGNFALISTMIDFLPFFNARLQGMYKLARASAAGENDKVLKVLSANLAMKGLKVAAFSLALAWMNDDDDRYKELPDWDKDANWHFWIGEDHWRIPKPFELGVVFGTMPERLFGFGTGSQTGSDLGRAVGNAVFNTMALNPIPQIALPVVEVMTNKSFFKGTAIEGMSDENRMPGDRYNAYTSDTAREVGQLLNVSPKKIEHLVNGYAGTLGGYVLAMSDMMARQMLGKEKPETPISRYPVIKAFYGGDAPTGSTYYQNEFYKALDAANQAYGSYKRASEEQDSSRMMAVLEDNRDKLGVRIALNRVQRQVSALSKQAEMVNNSSMSPSEKREKLDAITRQKNAIYQSAYVGFNLREW